MDKNKKKEELIKWIKRMGWSLNEFAREYYFREDADPEKVDTFIDTFKKQIKRETTKDETIEHYLQFLFSLDRFKKFCAIRPQNTSDSEFDKAFNSKMKKISTSINDELRECFDYDDSEAYYGPDF